MEPTEVRIGNYVLVPDMDLKVLIPSIAKKIIGITALGEFEFETGHFDVTMRIPAKHCKGIPLTTEHLEFIGFKKIAESQYMHRVLEMNLFDYKEFFIWTIHKNLNVRIEAVHHLQNLFAGMTMNDYIPDLKSFFQQHKVLA